MGSKTVFGILLIGIGIILAYLFVTGTLGKMWSLLTSGSLPTADTSASSTVTPVTGATTPSQVSTTPVVNTSLSSVSAAPVSNVTDPAYAAAQIAAGVNEIQALENYNPGAILPSSATVAPVASISSLPSVYSQTLASQSGVTGIIS